MHLCEREGPRRSFGGSAILIAWNYYPALLSLAIEQADDIYSPHSWQIAIIKLQKATLNEADTT
jgi:hypothetical protein